ncbi:flagellar filament capping protein FliD [Paludibacterium denitrificans]|uniref:Flagellar hook-associated protein 2 n=1 Tax=Paludibacterium denitrificans TaxID=2675226 RepID=A0A844GAW5_9NEIS|nr:flagellar filament capping protein FliD [Paludibacterium denitrificans]MTD32922.1 flagellar filament capping protein FliD [Paludibacterium denitrificans]
MIDTSTTSPSYMAQQLATAYTQGTQNLLSTQTQDAQTTSSALTSLQSALQVFQSALNTLSGQPTAVAQSATFSNSAIGSATANGTATAGSYQFFSEQLAQASQVAFQGVPAATPVGSAGTLVVKMADGTSLNVNLAAADTNGDGQLSPAEIASAINQNTANAKLAASVITVNGVSQMVVTAGHTGANSQISLDTSGVTDSTLASALGTANTLVAAQDSIVWLGAQGTGIKMQQASNTYTSIAGVSMTFSQARATGTAPVTLTVATDNSATAKNVQGFVDAYNSLKTALDKLTDTGDAANGKAAAAFASDAGVRSLRDRLNTIIRQTFAGGTLLQYGVSADRYGTLSLNQTKLQNALASNPTGLDKVLGGNSTTGLLGTAKSYLDSWLNFSSGQIKTRQDSVQRLQKDLTSRQSVLNDQYDQAYKRYLAQFSALQSIQSLISQNTGILSNLAGSGSSSNN